MSKAWDIVGYTYNADTYCADDCVITAMGEGTQQGVTVEDDLDHLAAVREITREDERSFDSGDFPKVIFQSSVESDDERCGGCGESLLS